MFASSIGLLRHSATAIASVSVLPSSTSAFKTAAVNARLLSTRPSLSSWQATVSKTTLQHRLASTPAFHNTTIATRSSVVSQVAGLRTSSTATAKVNGWIGIGAATTCVFGPLVWSKVAMMTPGLSYTARVTHCAPSTVPRSTYDFEREDEKIPWINSKELTFGMAMGLCSGYLFKKLGKMVMLVVGLGFVSLQLLANSGYITVNWVKVERKFKSQFDLDQDGQVTMNDAKHGFRGLLELLTRNFQFKSTFAGGFVLGFKYG